MILPRTHPNAVFFSKKGPLAWILGLVEVFPLWLGIRELRENPESIIGFFLVLVVMIGVWALLSARYEIHDETLVARAAFIRKTIPLNAIRELYPVRSWTSGIALSMDRFRINYVHPGGGLASFEVSPDQKEDFLSELRPAVRRAKNELGPAESKPGTYHITWMGDAPSEHRIEM